LLVRSKAVRVIAHHATLTEQLPSILHLGLTPRCPGDNPLWEGFAGSQYRAEAVYLFGVAVEVMHWAWLFDRDMILTVNVEGLNTEPPGLLPRDGLSAFRVYEPIAPERLIEARRCVRAGHWEVFARRPLGLGAPAVAGPSGNVVEPDNVEKPDASRGRPA
jgi:hypothetical protein